MALSDSRWFRRSFCAKKSSLVEMLAERCGWRIPSNLSKPPPNLPKLSHRMVLWFRETQRAAGDKWIAFTPDMGRQLIEHVHVKIKWGDEGAPLSQPL